MAIERIQFLKVPLDIVQPEELESVILELLARDGPRQIMLMSLWDVLRARRRGEFRSMVLDAALVLPTSKSLIRGARFLKKKTPVRVNPFPFVIETLGVLEKYCKSVYLLGAHNRSLIQAERNVRSTFPRLSVVGRFHGYYHRGIEKSIITAIVKSNPSLVLVGDGMPGKQRWIYRNRSRLHNGLFLWNAEMIDIFSERKRRIPESVYERGLEFFPLVARNPLRVFRLFQYFWYNVLLLTYRLFRTAS